MNIRYFQRGPVWWIDVRDGKDAEGKDLRKKVTTGKTDESEARRVGPELALQALVALRAPQPSPNGNSPQTATKGTTLGEAFKLAMKTREQWIQSGDPASLENTFNVLAGQLGEGFIMANLTRDYVRNLRATWLEEPGKRKGTKLSASTINGRLSMLNVLLESCDLPGHQVKHLSVKGTRRTRRVNQHEIRLMQAWLLANGHRKGALTLHDMMTVALDTGARAGELTDLPHGEVRLDDMTVTFRDTKNHETRTVPFDEASKRILEARRGLPDGPFADLNKSQRSALVRDMRAALGLDGDEDVVFHTLRHEAASRMVAAGIHPSIIQARLGHASYATTQVYVKVSLEAMREAQEQRARYEALKDLPAQGSVQ